MKTKLFLILLLTTSFVFAQNTDYSKLDILFNSLEEFDKGMGQISIFHDGKEVYARSYGYADIANQQKIQHNTKFRVGSVSKTFTATIIMKLIENGKLSLSTTLNKYYPQIQNADKITIQYLLEHRSGIANFTSVEDYMKWNTQEHSKEQVLERIKSGGVIFSPDERFAYSNSNYVLLAWIAEEVSGKTYAQLLEEMIIKPCALKNTYVGGKINPKNGEALSYTKLSEWKLEPETDMSIPIGAGFIVSTATDLNTFFYCLFNNKLLSMESLERMKRMKDSFGLGLIEAPFYNKRGYGHTGGIDGFQSNVFYFPEDKMSVAINSNAVNYPLNDILVAVLSVYYGREYKLPEFKNSADISVEQLDKYAGTYSSSTFPLKITIKRDKNTLLAQATGQPAFPLEFVKEDIFKFEQAKLKIEFLPATNELILRQFGGVYNLKKE